MYLVAFYGLFRIGELAIKSTRLASSVVQFNDLTFLSRKGHPHMAKIIISVYKHNTNNRPVYLSGICTSSICVQQLTAYSSSVRQITAKQ